MAIALDQPLDPSASGTRIFLDSIQGNILKSHGRDAAAHIFVRFEEDSAAVRTWIGHMGRTRVTSAAAQLDMRDEWIKDQAVDRLFTGLGLSATGYAAAGIPQADTPPDKFFMRGMKVQVVNEDDFMDPPSAQWEGEFSGRVDAIVILAQDVPDRLDDAIVKVQLSLKGVASAYWVERGERLCVTFPGEAEKTTIEHFGFEDGISNPLFFTDEIEKEKKLKGASKWDSGAPLALALTKEPGSEELGSYFVFRKLEQNVEGFTAALAELTALLGTSDPELAGAMAVGRYRNGRAILSGPGLEGPDANDFRFDEDDEFGKVCPFHAHIRRTNPRGDLRDTFGYDNERNHRIVRRGITYGARPDLQQAGGNPPKGDMGLLFMSHQEKLRNFTIQQSATDANDFPRPGAGVDAVISQNKNAKPQQWPYGSDVRYTIANFVKMLGGEYFFMPSMVCLRKMQA